MTAQLEASIEVRIPFHDVDSAGVVWHGHYFKYLELARCALLDKIGYNYTQMNESGYVWPVVDLNARFSRPIIYDQLVKVVARLEEWEYRLKIGYQILDLEGQECGRGKTIQVPVSLQTRELMVGSPKVLLDRMEALLEQCH
jgi:acyl-CoA thioester hydrolase